MISSISLFEIIISSFEIIHYLQMIKQKIPACVVTFDWYLFELIVRLNPDFNCCSSFWVD